MKRYKIINSPLGNIKITEEDGYLIEIQFTKDDVKNTSSFLLDECEANLNKYFKGELKSFDFEKLRLKLEGTNFQKSVWKSLMTIPYGKLISYKDLALSINSEKSYRACGNANGKNKFPIIIPCHRVINSNGTLGGYSGGLDIKIKLLEIEGTYNAIKK